MTVNANPRALVDANKLELKKDKYFDGSKYGSFNALLQKRHNDLFQLTIHIGFLLILSTFSKKTSPSPATRFY
jgi:hypothetical protein